jgi:hypothetical protein
LESGVIDQEAATAGHNIIEVQRRIVDEIRVRRLLDRAL